MRGVSLAVATAASLLIVVIGLAALVETDDPDWVLLVLGLVAFGASVPTLMFARGRPRGTTARRRT